jgi:hypothetical protein
MREIPGTNIVVISCGLFFYAVLKFSCYGLAKATGKPSKSLQRMLGPSGNPTAESLLGIIKVLQEVEHVQLRVEVARVA